MPQSEPSQAANANASGSRSASGKPLLQIGDAADVFDVVAVVAVPQPLAVVAIWCPGQVHHLDGPAARDAVAVGHDLSSRRSAGRWPSSPDIGTRVTQLRRLGAEPLLSQFP
jgi:hypothetical protein